jgi:DNA-binding response OmpR family regulator
MLLLMIDGDERDMAQLRELVPWAGFDIELRRIESRELIAQGASAAERGRAPAERDARASAEREGAAPAERDASAFGEPAVGGAAHHAERPTALLFEARDRPELGAAALTLVRSSRAFEGVPTIVALSVDRADWFAGAQGFDDFMLHPWSPGELLGRVRAARIRRRVPEADALVEINGVRMDPAAREASLSGESVHLTARELALLTYLCMRRGSVLSRNHLLEHVWGEAYRGGPRTVDVHIRRLRSKLGHELQIDTVRSGGYRLRAAGGARDARAGAAAPASLER